ncbi:unnamed protein product [Diamesa serratosioi]
MGSEQSQPASNSAQARQSQQGSVNTTPRFAQRPVSTAGRLERGYTIATASDSLNNSQLADISPPTNESRPISPPMSVCSDSDLPYISYTDKPIGESPKHRNKGQKFIKGRPTPNLRRQSTQSASTSTNRHSLKLQSTAHDTLVVVNRAGTKDTSIDKDPDIMRLQNIPMFLPVMRGTLSLPANRDPEILERLQPNHVLNMCSRLQSHYNLSATKVGQDQMAINGRIKETDQDITKLLNKMVEKQKMYSFYAESFARVRQISQQLSRCNTLLNQNIELMESLNNKLDLEDRLEPFVWTTN